jgi:hypothetical protein
MKLQKLGGYAAIALFCLTIANTTMLIVAFRGINNLSDVYDPVWMISAYQKAPAAFLAQYIIGIPFGILMVLLTMALRERMQVKAPNLMRLAVMASSAYSALAITVAIGGLFRNILVIGMNDMSVFRTFLVFHEFLFYTAASILGWGFLLIGCAALRTQALSRTLSYLLLADGVVSIMSFTFALTKFMAGSVIYGLLGLLVFLWLGAALLRQQQPQAAVKGMTARG